MVAAVTQHCCSLTWCCSAPHRFLELERPWLSKASRTLAFVYPYLFDSIPLFYRVCSHAGLLSLQAFGKTGPFLKKKNKLLQEKRLRYFFLPPSRRCTH